MLLVFSAVMLVERTALGVATAAEAAKAKEKEFQVRGVAQNTVTVLVPIDDATLHLEAEQVGHLSHFGHFTGEFTYTAELFPTGIVLHGTATLTNKKGEQLFLTAHIIETGTAEPFDVAGTLTITGGTGRFAGATGALLVSGVDEVSLTDTIQLEGAVLTPAD